jgi:DNA-binding NarL/FixJ family response regulator
VVAACVLAAVLSLRVDVALGLTSDLEVVAQAAAADRCGQVDGPLFGVQDGSVDPTALDTFRVADHTYQSSDFHLATLAVLELAWVAHQEVCIAEDAQQKPIGATAVVDACGDVLVGATWWRYRTGSAELDPNGQTNERIGIVHDTLMGFDWLDMSGDPTPPNFLTALKVAVDETEPDDCIAATLSWSASEGPIVASSISTSECLIASTIDRRSATFIEPANDWTYTFSLAQGSTITPVFEPAELGGVAVTAQRGLDGSVAITPVRLDGCPDARLDSYAPEPTPATTPAAAPIATPGPSPSASPAPTASPRPSLALTPVTTPSQAPTVGAVAAGLDTADPGSVTDAAQGVAQSGPPIPALLFATFLAAIGAVMFWRFFVHRPRFMSSPSVGSMEEEVQPPQRPTVGFRLEEFGLTPREREVLAMVAGGLTNREIGSALFITESTAGVHVSNILGKLGVDSRTDAARYALEAGIEPFRSVGPIH